MYSGTYGYAISNQMYGYLRSQEIAVSPGQYYYDVSAYMRGLIDPEDSFGSVLVRAAFYTSGGAAVSNVDAATVSPGSLTTTWQKRGGVVQVPATAAKLYLMLFTYHNTGWVTFDDAEVYLSDAQGNHTGSNLVANPGFETTSGWTRVPSTSYPATTFARSNDTGSLMKGRSGYGHSISNLAWGEIYTSSFIPTAAGKQYDLYAWVRGELDSDANFGNYQLRLAFYDSAGNPVSSLNSYAGDPASISPTWANRGGRVTVPVGVTQMKVLLRVDEVSGWVDFDDVELYEVVGGQRTGGNLAPDPGFETGSGWATTATFPNSTSFLRSTWGTADQHSGSYGWVISNHMYGTLTSDPISVTAGETYQVSAYLRGELDAEDSGGAWLIRVSYYNTAGTRISYHDVYTNSNNSFTGWQEKGDLTVAPASAVSMTVAVWNYMNSSWIGFDDVRVTAVSMKKYYYAGGQRVAMREGVGTGVTGLSFLFGDHLGSTSVTASSSGTKTGEVRYKAWGEDRYTSGATPTSYRFTGQRVDSYINLIWMNSRWYDPALGRWIQPDTIIPLGQGVQAFDRYAYVNNSPVVFNDPSGHCAICLIVAGVALVADVAYIGANAMGLIPDYVGIARAEAVMGRNGGSIEVAAGLAVQGEYSGYVDNFVGDIKLGSSGFGLAQTNTEEISALGLGDLDPNNPADAAQVMEARISAAQEACTGCSPTDLLIVAALAQNRSITANQIGDMSEGGGGINWGKFLNAPVTPGQLDAKIRQALTGIPYDRRFMLLKYIQDIRVLYRKGWALSDGITEADLDALEEAARTGEMP